MRHITGPPEASASLDNLNVGGAIGASQGARNHGHSGGNLGNMMID